MSELKQSWPIDAFDAVRLSAMQGDFRIEGTDGDQVELEGEIHSRHARDVKFEPAGRWLSVGAWARHGQGDLTLRLPRRKKWVVELWAPHGDAEIKGIQARLRLWMARGDIQIEDCQGQFSIASGHADIEIKRCAESEMPERPPAPEENPEFAGTPNPPIPPTPPMPGGPFMFGLKQRLRSHLSDEGVEEDSSWEDWDPEEWTRWGEEIGERAAAWAEGFVARLAGPMRWASDQGGVSIHIGQGDVELSDVTAKTAAIRTGNGDIQLRDGRIEKLSVQAGHGDIECRGVLPAGEWTIETRNGDIQLDLPRETRSRLDVATRHGDIDSEVPLVRVGRPGRESRHGGRMVGTSGMGEPTADVGVTTVHGDIQISGPRGEPGRYERPAPAAAAAPTPPVGASGPFAPTPPVPGSPQASDVPSSPQASDRPASNPASEDRPAEPKYVSQMAVLQALADGRISVTEAEQLLKSLER